MYQSSSSYIFENYSRSHTYLDPKENMCLPGKCKRWSCAILKDIAYIFLMYIYQWRDITEREAEKAVESEDRDGEIPPRYTRWDRIREENKDEE